MAKTSFPLPTCVTSPKLNPVARLTHPAAVSGTLFIVLLRWRPIKMLDATLTSCGMEPGGAVLGRDGNR